MKRLGVILLVAATSLAAAPRDSGFKIVTPSEEWPVPPVPPAAPPAYTAAPVPNIDAYAPAPTPQSNDPHLSPQFFHQKDYYTGQGYTPGSSIYGEQQRKQGPMGGINLKVPLE
jgi:hypothetical protein